MKSIWRRLKEQAEQIQQIMTTSAIQTSDCDMFTEDLLHRVLLQRRVDISDYELFKLLIKWCEREQKKLLDYIDYVDFGRFTPEELSYAIVLGIPRPILFNALNKSKLLSPQQLCNFLMEVFFLTYFKLTEFRGSTPTGNSSIDAGHLSSDLRDSIMHWNSLRKYCW